VGLSEGERNNLSLAAGFGGGGYSGNKGDKGLSMPLAETFRLAFADPDLRQRLLFVLFMFGVFALGVHVPVPIPGVRSADLNLQGGLFDLLNSFGGGALRKLSIFALGLNPYITASIIMQVLTTANPVWKKELQEGGEYARKQQNKRTRLLTIALCLVQGFGLLTMISGAAGSSEAAATIAAMPFYLKAIVVLFWTAGSMFTLWLGEQISEKGIGNGVSLMIFAGIVISLPMQMERLWGAMKVGEVQWYQVAIVLALFLGATWLIVYFTTAQRRIPIQHMRRQVGTKMMGGQTSYLPLSVNMAGVLPIIFAVSLIYLPSQFGLMFGGDAPNNPSPMAPVGRFLTNLSHWMNPGSDRWEQAVVGSIVYTGLIFFFTYFWTAIQYNVEDISNNLKRGGSFIPGVRPGKQTKDFLDQVISRITLVGAAFIAVVALLQYIAPRISGISYSYINLIGGTSLLIMVQVALETMRQIEANLLMKQYGS
jgi:preprotein translocase subunit SecY